MGAPVSFVQPGSQEQRHPECRYQRNRGTLAPPSTLTCAGLEICNTVSSQPPGSYRVCATASGRRQDLEPLPITPLSSLHACPALPHGLSMCGHSSVPFFLAWKGRWRAVSSAEPLCVVITWTPSCHTFKDVIVRMSSTAQLCPLLVLLDITHCQISPFILSGPSEWRPLQPPPPPPQQDSQYGVFSGTFAGPGGYRCCMQ